MEGMNALNKDRISYIDVERLRLTYSVYGSFYNIRLNEKESIPCRNVLDIVADKKEGGFLPEVSVPTLYGCLPDAYFCMMNPGSSAPQPTQQEVYGGPPEYKLDGTLPQLILGTPMVSARPDNTQFMVMNVMHYVGIHHVRVINLSDIREPKSKEFVEKITKFYTGYKHHVHSIFDPLRNEELRHALGAKKSVPVIAAWGKNKKYLDLIRLCKTGIRGVPCRGLFDDADAKELCRHPLPPVWEKQMEWLSDMVDLLQ